MSPPDFVKPAVPAPPPASPSTSRQWILLLWRIVFGIYVWWVFLTLALLALPLLLWPELQRRRRMIRTVARAVLLLAGARLRTDGLDALPLPCVVVANHGSYLDGVVLCAALPPHFAFVIKREMHGVPLAGWLLMRIGSHFVERGNRPGSARDALRVIRSAAQREALAFFPEGTFQHRPGLLRFHTGAFAAAVSGRLPLVPLVIEGTRECLPPRSILPRHGTIAVRALPALHATDRTDAAAELRDRARAQMLAALGIADLAAAS